MKCLPSTKLPLATGFVLHDWHAEILAFRAFNRFLLDQLHLLLTHPHQPSQFIRHRLKEELNTISFQPFTIKEDVKIYMYCSEAPCGDASMELVMDAQEDATPWTSPIPRISSHSDVLKDSGHEEEAVGGLRGRSHFSHLGALRYKPSRPDAPPTLSKSCTDKLALKQATSLLSSLTSLLISPQNAYIDSVILPNSQLVPSACERAFSGAGRMNGFAEEGWKGGYRWREFEVRGTQREFVWSRRAVGRGENAIACNVSALWTPGWQETLIGGVLQGRRQFDPRGASSICRRSMWKMAVQIAAVAGVPAVIEVLEKSTYNEVKDGEILAERSKVKVDVQRAALKGWVKNSGDDEFRLEATQKS
jgi:tRNA-specific adenosine deaminase 1